MMDAAERESPFDAKNIESVVHRMIDNVSIYALENRQYDGASKANIQELRSFLS